MTNRQHAKAALGCWDRAVTYLRAVSAGDEGCTGAYRAAASSWVSKCAGFGWAVKPPVAVEWEMPR